MHDVVRILITKRLWRPANPAWPAGFDVFEMAGPLLCGPRLVVRWRRLFSVTTIRVDHHALVITTGLLRRSRRLPAPDLANVFVTREDEHFVLLARDWDGEVHELVELDTLEQARWLEARIEQHLGLDHIPGPGPVDTPQTAALQVSSWSA